MWIWPQVKASRVSVQRWSWGRGCSIKASGHTTSAVTVVDAAGLEVLRTIPVGDDPHGLTIDSAGSSVYVANMGTGDISVIALDSYKEIKRLEAGRAPFGMALAPDGHYLYVSSQLSNPVPFIKLVAILVSKDLPQQAALK